MCLWVSLLGVDEAWELKKRERKRVDHACLTCPTVGIEIQTKVKYFFLYVTLWVCRTDATFLSDINYMIIVM